MSSRRRQRSAGSLALVLHSHMPYVEGGAPWPRPRDELNPAGFGTWPFGEEWLWEAIATSYLPLLDVLGRAPITLSLTPVLADQLETPGSLARCIRFLTEIRSASHRSDIEGMRAAGDEELIPPLERSAAAYAAAAERLEGLPDGLLGALRPFASWTSAASHAVLPLLVSDAAITVQLGTGIASHRRRFGHWGGGLWLPECGYAPWLDPLLADAGVRATCLELTARFGLGAQANLDPLVTEAGVVIWPLDRATVSLVWHARGYPAAGAYRDSHRRTTNHHHAWSNEGRPYDESAAAAQARLDAQDFVARVKARVAGGGVCVCALDTELLGHWWLEGPTWLGAVVEEAGRQELELLALDDALERHEPRPLPSELVAPITWGEGGDLRTWSGPPVADLVWRARTAELSVLRAREPSARAVRELLALQASDWPFLATRRLAGDYPRERVEAHAGQLELALRGTPGMAPEVRNLAPDVVAWPG